MQRRIIWAVSLGLIALVVLIFGIRFFGGNKSRVSPQVVNAKQIFAQAQAKEKEGNLILARRLYQQVLLSAKDIAKIQEAKDKVEQLNMKIIFSPLADEYSEVYEVKANDNLGKIAKKFSTTIELIKKANNLSSDVIRPRQKLKVNKVPFSILIDKSQNILLLKRGQEVVKTYIVSTGKNNSTPVGVFKIVNKLKNPTWFKTGAVIPSGNPENILGTRWLGLSIAGYGIHGTNNNKDLGKQISSGCIRMRNSDVEELYTLIPVGTKVTIID